jgi:hypothetical protein
MGDSLLSILLAPAVILLAVATVAAIAVGMLVMRARRRRMQRRADRRRRKAETERVEMAAAEAVSIEIPRAYPMPVIEVIEERVFDQLDDLAAQSVMGHRVLPRLSLNAFLYIGSKGVSRAEEQEAKRILSSRQVDFLVVDGDWQPVVAVNLERDALASQDDDGLEAEICVDAGVAYFTVAPKGLTDAQLAEIRVCLGRAQAVAAQ